MLCLLTAGGWNSILQRSVVLLMNGGGVRSDGKGGGIVKTETYVQKIFYVEFSCSSVCSFAFPENLKYKHSPPNPRYHNKMNSSILGGTLLHEERILMR